MFMDGSFGGTTCRELFHRRLYSLSGHSRERDEKSQMPDYRGSAEAQDAGTPSSLLAHSQSRNLGSEEEREANFQLKQT